MKVQYIEPTMGAILFCYINGKISKLRHYSSTVRSQDNLGWDNMI